MRLYNGTIRPGKIITILEPGVIKASAPGLFSEVDKEKLPPIYPFFNIMGSHSNCYSEPKVGDEVWVMNFSDNPMQLYWFRKDKHINNNITSGSNVEILCDRQCESGSASIYFSDGTGWVMTSSGSQINITKDGDIILDSKLGSTIHINDNISLGKVGGSSHTACYADECMKILSDITSLLSTIEVAANGSPYTKHIGAVMSGKPSSIAGKIPNIESKTVTLE